MLSTDAQVILQMARDTAAWLRKTACHNSEAGAVTLEIFADSAEEAVKECLHGQSSGSTP